MALSHKPCRAERGLPSSGAIKIAISIGAIGVSPDDPFNLLRFVTAQAPVIETVLHELNAGRKRSHWMWFVFPQLRGLGSSPMATFFGIASLDEARAYLAHPLLGARLTQCTEAVLTHKGTSLSAIFGSPDDLKFHSSMTLFTCALDGRDSVFHRAVEHFCDGQADERTLTLLRGDA